MATVYNSTHTGQQIGNILDMIYPVGSIYLSVNNVDPSTLFGGAWERIEGKFLLASSSTHAIGTTGGEETTILNINNLPAHTHNSKTLTGDVSFRDLNTGDHNLILTASGIVSASYPTWSGSHDAAQKVSISTYKYNNLSFNVTHEHDSIGGNVPHNNMPPYLTVNMWKRIS